MRKILAIVISVMIVVMFAPASAFASTNQLTKAVPHEALKNTNVSIYELNQSMITKAIAYVHVSNYHAIIDPAIVKVLTTSEVQVIQTAVIHYNSLPVAQKQPHFGSISPSYKVGMFSKKSNRIQPYIWPFCTDTVYVYQNWWGYSYWLNHCAANDLYAGGWVASIVIDLVLALTGVGAPAAIIAGAIEALALVDINWAMNQCSGNIWVNVWTASSPSFAWVTPVC